ncbi:hypothetical protein [Streptomyces sp. NPDC006997]|uniref:hypothetical protein n=1 Tax=Streptomyces sp. NPDC006997 TaxID=3155356 RepID=UPI0033D75360
MTRPPTAAQRRVIDAADPVTGRLRGGTETQLAALVKRGLAFRHPRPPHDHFLTPAGHRVREGVRVSAEASQEVAESAGVFAARVGGEAAASGVGRAREVRSAWEGLVELRRMTNPDGAIDRPCGWERTHLVRAVALALEAAEHRPAGAEDAEGGYRVRGTPQPEAVAVYEPDAGALRACAATLERAGWQTSEHTEPRTRARYLLASPRRA